MEIPEPDFRDLMAAIGETLLHWGFLETAMKAAGITWSSTAKSRAIDPSNGEILEALAEPRRIRNLIAHGLTSASADPRRGKEPFVICRDVEEQEHRITLADLRKTQAQIHKLRMKFRAMSD
jgi:hypothetical protein